MAIPLPIHFASKCAFSATNNWIDLVDPNSDNRLKAKGSNFQFEQTSFNTKLDQYYAITYPFYGNSTLTGFFGHTQMGHIMKGTGARKDEVLITFRGSNRLSDILIDGACAFGTSSKGYAVHGGFAKVFQSCIPDIKRILGELGYFHTIHCTGHSMRGALATLAAEYFINSNATPHLYSFGAPRVGGIPHTQFMKSNMGDRINRYYYASDWITWLPMFPYVHLPGKRLITANSLYAGHTAYQHPRNLIQAGGLRAETTGDSWQDAEDLIKQGGSAGGGWGIESRAWRLFTQALHKIMLAAGAMFGLAFFTGVTALDQIVAAISYLITQNPNRRPLIVRWMVGSFKLLGKVITVGTDKFVSLLKYLLNIMLSNIRTKNNRAMAEITRNEEMQQGKQLSIRFC